MLGQVAHFTLLYFKASLPTHLSAILPQLVLISVHLWVGRKGQKVFKRTWSLFIGLNSFYDSEPNVDPLMVSRAFVVNIRG